MKEIIIILILILLLLGGCMSKQTCTVNYVDSDLLLIGNFKNVTVNGINFGECCCAGSGGITNICSCRNK